VEVINIKVHIPQEKKSQQEKNIENIKNHRELNITNSIKFLYFN